jgi:hypothetical protein
MTNETPSTRSVRLQPWYSKFAYVVVAVAVVYLAPVIPLGAGGAGILRSALAFVLILLRMTSAVPSGILLGAVCAAVALVSIVGYAGLTVATLPHKDVADLPVLLVTAVLSAILAYLYFGSSRRIVVERRERAIVEARAGRTG